MLKSTSLFMLGLPTDFAKPAESLSPLGRLPPRGASAPARWRAAPSMVSSADASARRPARERRPPPGSPRPAPTCTAPVSIETSRRQRDNACVQPSYEASNRASIRREFSPRRRAHSSFASSSLAAAPPSAAVPAESGQPVADEIAQTSSDQPSSSHLLDRCSASGPSPATLALPSHREPAATQTPSGSAASGAVRSHAVKGIPPRGRSPWARA